MQTWSFHLDQEDTIINTNKMIIFSLLIITISGIAAIPYEKSLQSNIDVNQIDSELESLDRIKRSADNWVTIRGDQYKFTYGEPDSQLTLLSTVFSPEPLFHYNKFRITHDLNYTTWDQLLSHYTYADFNEKIHIEFYRNDKQGATYDVRVLPQAIPLHKIKKVDIDTEQFYNMKLNIVLVTSPSAARQQSTQLVRDVPFNSYHQKIFDESIYVGATRLNIAIHITMEGFKKDNELILQLVIKVCRSEWFSTSGLYLRVSGYNEIVLK